MTGDEQKNIHLLIPSAIKIVLYSIAEKDLPEVITEIKAFSDDRGSVHSVFWEYLSSENISVSILTP